MESILVDLKKELRQYINKEKAKFLPHYFKTGLGGYGEGDLFLGVVVPDSRKVAKKYCELQWEELKNLLKSEYHEERFVALCIMNDQFLRGNEQIKKRIYRHYMSNVKYINNWDLVDTSARFIPGPYLETKDKQPLIDFAKSKDLWKRRISIISTFPYIKKGKFKTTFAIADLLLKDEHDLIHKAVGWMLREVGNMDQVIEKKYLQKNYQTMPRMMLRYAIEKFSPEERKIFLKK